MLYDQNPTITGKTHRQSRVSNGLLVVMLLAICVPTVSAVTLEFQQGVDSYSGCLDTTLKETSPTSSFGSATTIDWDDSDASGNDIVCLIIFDDIFGSGEGQIDSTDKVYSATLTYEVTNIGDDGDVYEAAVSWDESTTWNSFGDTAGVQVGDYGDSVGSAEGGTAGTQSLDVTDSIIDWTTTPANNLGWLVLPTANNGVNVRSSEDGTSSLRPKLTVVIPEVTRGPYLQMPTPTAITVRWRTDDDCDSVVRYGTSVESLTSSASDATETTEHEVRVTGLSANTKYYYSIGTNNQTLAGGTASHFFYTPPTVGTRQPTRVWAMGCFGTANADARAVRDAYYDYTGSTYTDLFLMCGDNAYPDGTDAEYQAAVFNTYDDLLEQTVFYAVRGNHDKSLTVFQDVVTNPTSAEAGGYASGSESYYSFDYANIHFVGLDSYGSNRTPEGAMLTWLEDDLDTTSQDWIIAFWHAAPYSKGGHDSDTDFRMEDMREYAVPLLEDYGVDLVLCSHSHNYERSFLINGHHDDSNTLTSSMVLDSGDGRVDGDGPYIKAAGAENGAVYALVAGGGATDEGDLDHPAIYSGSLQMGSITFDVNGGLLEAKMIDKDGNIDDHYTIIKTGLGPPAVYAGPDQTIATTDDTVTLDATVVDDGLPDPPGSVTTTWTKESGSGTVTFGDSSSVDTTATFSQPGTYVLRLTADDDTYETYDELTVSVRGLENGDFDDGFTSGVGDSWTTYVVGGATPTFVSGGGNPFPGQRGDYTKTRETRYYGIYQTVDATVGDALTFGADVYCITHSNKANCSLRVDWGGGTSITGASTIVTADQPEKSWTAMGYGSGNATDTSVTLFVDVRGFDDNNEDTDTYWDNITLYQAHVPPAPDVHNAGVTSLEVDIIPGGNSDNSNAEYAVSIGGGAYTLGTHWVQANGTVGTSEAWQTDSSWSDTEVTSLTTGTFYTMEAKARYSSTYTQETCLGDGDIDSPETTVTVTTHPSAQNICPGGTAQFTVAATGTLYSLTYQWQKDSSDLANGGHYSGVTTATLTVSSTDSGDAGSYRCVVSSEYESANSNTAALTVKDATTITVQPSNAILETGETATFSVTATGEGAVSYQWQQDQSDLANGGDYSGCTTATLTIVNVEAADEANYRCVVTATCGSANSNEVALVINDCEPGTELDNGDFASGFTSGVADGYTTYCVGGSTPTFVSGNGNPNPGQRADYTKTRLTRFYGIRQLIDATAGDAFTFTADVWCYSNYFYATCALRTDWAGGTTPAESSQICAADQAKQTWTSLPYGSGNATSTQIMIFCDVRGTTDSNSDTDTYWDNLAAYRAHLPPAPIVNEASSTSLSVDVNPGCNSENSSAEYAITIDGGAYTEGTHWVQSDGTVSTSTVWQTDSTWGNEEVTGLTTSTTYTFKAKARYSSSITEDTTLGSGASGTP